ncbi:MAG: DUF3108 domain-containing protein, partial [Bryobacteraceae bacterium]|nr:DUF3108 domain-containing protein [Bryobacteraceae bacterium]
VAVSFLLGCSILAAQPKPVAAPPAKPKVTQTEARINTPTLALPAPEPKAKSETLHFNVNWPSGLSLGEGELTSTQTAQGWSFSFNVYAGIPGFGIVETARSKATTDLCSLSLSKEGSRGKKKVNEQTTFDSAKLTATRQTGKDGGKSEMRVSACVRDALTFIQFARRELAAGRLPAAQPVYYGAGYQTRLQYAGTQKVTAGKESPEADKLTGTIKGPASDLTIEMFFARDAARTPMLVRIPVAMGKFTVEFVR